MIVVGYNNCGGSDINLRPYGAKNNSTAPSQSVGGGIQVTFCVPPGRILGPYVMANLTSLMRSGQLMPDSDADGLTDAEESPNLVGVRHHPGSKLLGIVEATSGQTTPLGACSTSTNLGFNDCDLQILNISSSRLDQDDDGVLDFLEVLRGMNPNDNADAQVDSSSEGITNLEKILFGAEPNAPYGSTNPSLLLQYDVSEDPTVDCTTSGGGLGERLTVSNLPLVPTVATQFPVTTPPSMDQNLFGHAAGENIIFFAFEAQSSDSQIWGVFFKATYGGAVNVFIGPAACDTGQYQNCFKNLGVR